MTITTYNHNERAPLELYVEDYLYITFLLGLQLFVVLLAWVLLSRCAEA